MQELRSEIIGNRRVCLVVHSGVYYAVTIEVRGLAGWEDSSLRRNRIWHSKLPAGATASVWVSSNYARLSWGRISVRSRGQEPHSYPVSVQGVKMALFCGRSNRNCTSMCDPA
jgi:hypothetical protein